MSNFPADFKVPRPISSKRSTTRDPSNRKSVSFNDTPIVHEVPSNDTTRNSATETCRSWIFTDVTQKLNSLRLHDVSTPQRSKELTTDDETLKIVPSISPLSVSSSLTSDDRKSLEIDSSRSSHPNFHYLGPVSESTATYTNILSTSLISPVNEPLIHSRPSRIRSANFPSNLQTFRPMESISITPLRSSRMTLRPSVKTSRYVSPTIQRPTTTRVTLSPRSRSAHVSSSSQQRKRSPNVRQSYGSYYMHRVLLPATIN